MISTFNHMRQLSRTSLMPVVLGRVLAPSFSFIVVMQSVSLKRQLELVTIIECVVLALHPPT